MPRLDSADKILSAQTDVAPTVTDAKAAKTDSKPRPKPSPKKAIAKEPKVETPKGTTFRCTLSIYPESETAKVIQEIIDALPERAKKHMSVGGLMTQLVKENDDLIARLLAAPEKS